MKGFLLALGLLLAAGTASAQSCAMPQHAGAAATQLGTLANQVRARSGASGLSANRQLSQAAQVLACDIAQSGRIGHRTRKGQNSMMRVTSAGYRACLVAENIAWGFPRPSQIVNGWLGSSGHARNLLHPRVSQFGVGLAQGSRGPIWVMIYARPC